MKTIQKRIKPKATLSELGQLKKLARQIRDGHEATEKFIASSKGNARSALNEALITGEALVKAKNIVGFGGFTRWIKEHCKKLSHDTCNRYMTLYKSFGNDSAHVRNLPEMNLRKAYLMLGIINEPVIPDRERGGVVVEQNYDAQQSSRKLLTNGATSEAQSSSNNESIDKQSSDQPIDVEIIPHNERPHIVAGISDDSYRQACIVDFERSYNALHIDLINMIKSGLFKLDEIKDATLEPLRQFFSQTEKHGHPPAPKKESFFRAIGNAG